MMKGGPIGKEDLALKVELTLSEKSADEEEVKEGDRKIGI